MNATYLTGLDTYRRLSKLPELNFLDIQWEYEDELPDNLEDGNYNLMFKHSKIIDGVKMFPYVELDNKRYYLQ